MKLKCTLCAVILLVMAVFIPNVNAADVTASTPYSWSSVAIGGGGFTTGIVAHPKEPDLLYARSDVGGVYRWDDNAKTWISLMGSFGIDQRNYFGVDGIALDPNNPDVVYIAAGKDIGNGISDVLKSTDRGATWVKTNLNKRFSGNGKLRFTGELIAVDPSNSNIVYVGTRQEGLYRSQNAGLSWERIYAIPTGEPITNTGVTGFPESSEAIGIRGVTFGKNSASGGKSQTIYVNVMGKGIYQSTNGGTTWGLISNSPTLAARMESDIYGNLYVTTIGQGVQKYSGGAWYDITPPDSDKRYCGLSIDPYNESNIIVARWGYESGASNNLPIYRSKNGGRTWECISLSANKNRVLAPRWYPDDYFFACTSQVLFDPCNEGYVYGADWHAVWKTLNIWDSADKTQWYGMTKGLENTCTLALSTPKSGAHLISGGADYSALRHSDLGTAPKDSLLSLMGNVNSIDYCESDPNYVAVTGSKTWNSYGVFAVSEDNGKTFNVVSKPDGSRNGRVAYSATDPDVMVWVPQGGAPIRTTDRGNSWSTTSGAPSTAITEFWLTKQPLASDRVNGKKFYLCSNKGTGTASEFYRSEDSGATWELVNSTDLAPCASWDNTIVKAAPGIENEVWVSEHADGLYRSSDGGNTFTKLDNVQTARLFAFGKNPPGKSYPTVFVLGTVNNISDKVFRSDDMGKTWIRINDAQTLIGNVPNSMEGDRQEFGQVYIGTNGSGVVVGKTTENTVLSDEFSSGVTPDYAYGGAYVKSGELRLPNGAGVSGIKLPKNSSIEFDIKTGANGRGKFYIGTRKNLEQIDEYYNFIYVNDVPGNVTGFKIERLGKTSYNVLDQEMDSSKYRLLSDENVHIKYVTFEDKIGIYFNGEPVMILTDGVVNKGGIIYEMNGRYEAIDSTSEAIISNLRIKKVTADECSELYDDKTLKEDFNGIKPWYANDNCEMTDGRLKVNSEGGFKDKETLRDCSLEMDLDFEKNGNISEANAGKHYSMQWKIRKTFDSSSYYTVELRYYPYYNKMKILTSKNANGVYTYIGEANVDDTNSCRFGIFCNGNRIWTEVDGKKVCSWVDDIEYSSSQRFSVAMYSWTDLPVDLYMDNYSIRKSGSVVSFDNFVDELVLYRDDGSIVLDSSGIKEGTTYSLKTTVSNFSSENADIVLCVALYQDNKLAKLYTQNRTITAHSYNAPAQMQFGIDAADIDKTKSVKLKAMLFDSLENIKPLVNCTTIS